jgi:MFS family permease
MRAAPAVTAAGAGPFDWWRNAPRAARKTFVAASLGWMLDAFDVMLFSMVIASLVEDPSLHLSLSSAGVLGSVTLLAAAAGGIGFGVVADRFGRKQALMAAVLLYSVFTAACGFAQSALQLAIFRVLVGLGMGGEWATGATMVAEAFPAVYRTRALAFVQSSWAIGYAAAALANLIVLPVWGWRGVFFVGILPALFTLWVRTGLEESKLWRSTPAAERGRLGAIFAPGVRRLTLVVTLMNASTLFGWWGLNGWVPAYLRLSPAEGGIGLGSSTMSVFVIAMQVGMWLGYVSFGFIADRIGLKRAYVTFVLLASVLLPLYGLVAGPVLLLALGPVVAFFGTGYFSGFGAVTAEIFPTAIRATAQGVTYNIGRGLSALAPITVGALSAEYGLGAAFSLTSGAFVLAAVLWIWIPETRGRRLDDPA